MSPAARAFIVVDLGFGDAGKGLVTDHLVRQTAAEVVVRFNGGAQAGHNVVSPDGRHHTFAQFGAGTLAGARTLLSADVLVHPTALLAEANALGALQLLDPLARIQIHRDARLITPFHQAANRIRERARGAARHGSCGVGVGETVQDDLAYPEQTVRASDLLAPALLAKKLSSVRARKREEMRAIAEPDPSDHEWQILEEPSVARTWIGRTLPLRREDLMLDDAGFGRALQRSSGCIFEGAQGVLLDEEFGFHPFTTWSRCTDRNARVLLARHAPDLEPVTVGVLRSHVVRHGAGPLPTETDALQTQVQDHNTGNPWQGQVRYGWFDGVLARYALEVLGRVDLLALTHVDLIERLDAWRLCEAYRVESAPGPRLQRLPVNTPPALPGQERLTGLLQRAHPEYVHGRGGAAPFLQQVEQQLGRPLDALCRGPRATDLSFRTPL